MPAPAFSWGDGGAQMTPEAIAAQRKVAEALMAEGRDYSPILSPWQGAARVTQAMMGGLDSRMADQAEKANRTADQETIAKLLGGGTAPGAPLSITPAAAPDAVPTRTAGDPAAAIAGIESGGKYDMLGPVTKTGDRAYGKYQVMGANVPAWTKAHLGSEMTPDQFLANPQAQDAVFKGQFGQYSNKYGPEGAAKAWFAGEGGMNNPNAKDMLGTTVASYADKFNRGMGRPDSAVPASAPAVSAPTPVAQAAPAASGGLQGVNPALIHALTSPYSGEGVKKVATLLLQQQMDNKVTYQTTPDGDVLAMDPHGRTPPKVVYQATPKPISVAENAQLWDPRTRSFINPSPPVTSITGADGKQIPIPAGQDPKKFREHVTTATADAAAGKLTEVQSNATQFANRMEDATKNIDKLEPDITSGSLGTVKDRVMRGVTEGGYNPIPRGATNWAVSDKYQSYDQAKSQFITALLRKESGAAISQSEFDRYSKEFFPTMGDSNEVIAQKKQARSVALEAMKKGAGPIYQSPKDSMSASGPSIDDLVKKYSK